MDVLTMIKLVKGLMATPDLKSQVKAFGFAKQEDGTWTVTANLSQPLWDQLNGLVASFQAEHPE